ncbi:Tyrosine-protein kinase [Aphelenchoides besseyi]|nr:Tyrosine-protein kinase [Aphelenchoides besseyi]
MGGCVSKQQAPLDPINSTLNAHSSSQIGNANNSINTSTTTYPVPNFYLGQSQVKLSTSSVSDSPRLKPGEEQVIALYPYESRSDGDLSFKKGDVMFLLESSNSDWWFVRTKDGQRQGYVPKNFVAIRTTVESEEWFGGNISRSQAERLVLSSKMPSGTFLIRERDSVPKEYALTVRDNNDTTVPSVKHYRIKLLDNGNGFYITSRSKFSTLKQLVKYYSQNADGLCTQLSFPAPRAAPVRPDLSSETQVNWERPRHEIQLKEKLGDGNFGEVWRGKWQGIVEVAIKTMKPGTMTSEAFLEEAHIMKQIAHPNLIKLYGVCTKDEPFFIITEFMQNGALLHYLRDDKNTLSMRAMMDICAQIAHGMTYLETKKLVHRDLAARNVLVGEIISGVPVVKVADFGLARKLMEENVYEARMGAKFPIKWTAPEAAACGNFTVKSDVWSFGILLYEIFTKGHTPYVGMQNRQVLEEVDRGYRMPIPRECPPAVYHDAMLKCWQRNPEQRPTFAFLYSYFDDFYVASQTSYVPDP